MIHHCRRGAGVIVVNGDKVLLGRELDGWSGFGGGAKGWETSLKTAARETEEESAGIVTAAFVCDRARVQLLLSTPRGYAFSMFIVHLHDCDATLAVHEFSTRREKASSPECQEKLELKWVPIKSVPHLKLRKGFSCDWGMIGLAIQIVSARHARPRLPRQINCQPLCMGERRAEGERVRG